LYLSPSFLALVEAERVLLYSSLGEKLVGLSFASQSERKLLHKTCAECKTWREKVYPWRRPSPSNPSQPCPSPSPTQSREEQMKLGPVVGRRELVSLVKKTGNLRNQGSLKKMVISLSM